MANDDFTGKVAIVTGAGRRMGRAIALRLADEGADIVVNCKSALARAQGVAQEIEARGRRALPIAADVTDPAAVKRMIDATMARFGRIDILVNNVAIRHRRPLAEITLAEWHEVLQSTLDGSFLCAQAAAPHLQASAGAIVNIGGASAHYNGRGRAHVVTAKMGLIGLTRALALDLAPSVVVNCLVPGRIDAPADAQPDRSYPLERIPVGRPGTLDEVAEAVVMLCSPRLRFHTGQTVHLNGGMYFGL